MIIPQKSLHVLNWFYGNICVKKCYGQYKKERNCYDVMRKMIEGNEDYPITHKMFIKVVREKHKICDISEELFRHSEGDFYRRQSDTTAKAVA